MMMAMGARGRSLLNPVLAVTLAAGLAAGCYPNPDDLRPGGNSGAGGNGTTTGDTASLSSAFCSQLQACAPARLTSNFGTLAACQTRDGMVQLISSRNHYAFNLAWAKQPPRR